MKVTVSVHGRYHAFELANGLHERGHLSRLLTTYPRFAVRKLSHANLPVKSAPLLELRRRLYGRFGIGRKPDLVIARNFARFAARNLPDDSDILVGWSSATLETIKPAKERGMKVVVERGSTHIAHQTDVLEEAYRSCGLGFEETAPAMIEREEREYAEVDFISVPSSHAAQSFTARGIDEGKLIVNTLGVDLSRFSPAPIRPINAKPRIIFAGGVGIRKGVPWLLRAFRTLSDQAELHLYGLVDPAFREMLHALHGDNVFVHGPVSADTLAKAYAKADIFCLPSIEEGFGLVVPQAMASGLPVVVSEAVGASDLITPGIEGLVVPVMDENALGDALLSLIDGTPRRHAMGDAAAIRVATGNSWDDYVGRAVARYEKALGYPGPGPT
jgi:glycosyltransferase involved in cell wall biosynthesis